MKQFNLFLFVFCLSAPSFAQNVGINTMDPQRALDVQGTDDQHIRIQTTVGSESALELVNGSNAGIARDWKIANGTGTFSLLSGTNNFSTAGETFFRINSSGNVGLNSVISDSRLHVNNGFEASNTEHGHMVIGSLSAINMVVDQNEINVRNNGNASTLHLQETGGHAYINFNGGNTLFGTGGGNVGVGTSSTPRKLSVESTSSFHLYLRNSVNGINDWYIGPSNSSWTVGDNHLLFAPSSSSSASIFRLMDVPDNDGEVAPVIIHSSDNQTLLLDGNEIDSREGPLYINHNSDQNTLINPSGGSVGAATSDPFSTFHILRQPGEYALRLQRENVTWNFQPVDASNQLTFSKNGADLASVNGVNGQWVALSDRTRKKEIRVLDNVLDKVSALGLYSYNYLQDPNKTRQFGVLAQEILPLFPEVVDFENDEYAVAYGQLAVIALKALQDQQSEIDALQAELNQLLDSQSIH